MELGIFDGAIWLALLFVLWNTGGTKNELRKIRELLEKETSENKT